MMDEDDRDPLSWRVRIAFLDAWRWAWTPLRTHLEKRRYKRDFDEAVARGEIELVPLAEVMENTRKHGIGFITNIPIITSSWYELPRFPMLGSMLADMGFEWARRPILHDGCWFTRGPREIVDAQGWPVEQLVGRPVTNLIRLALHARGTRRRD